MRPCRNFCQSPASAQALLAAEVGSLAAPAEGCTTSDLARRLNVTAAAASQHATVLRNTDLITTSRRGGSVLHHITPRAGSAADRRPDKTVRPEGSTASGWARDPRLPTRHLLSRRLKGGPQVVDPSRM
jgi:DNA-binding transcriptional ArsR family regulator